MAIKCHGGFCSHNCPCTAFSSLASLETNIVSISSTNVTKIIRHKNTLFSASQSSNSHPPNYQAYAQPTSHYMFHDISCTHTIIIIIAPIMHTCKIKIHN